MRMIRVELSEESREIGRRVWNNCTGRYLEGDDVQEVSDVPFWRDMLKRGVLVVHEPAPRAPASPTPTVPSTPKGSRGRTRGSQKAKGP